MKNYLKLAFLPAILLTSCVHKGEFYLSEKYYTKEASGLLQDSDFSLIEAALNNNESFGAYIYTVGCGVCAKFEPVITEFLKKYDIQFLSPTYQVMKQTDNPILDHVKYAPGVIIFHEGKYVADLDSNDEKDTDAFNSVNGFTSWVTQYIKLSLED